MLKFLSFIFILSLNSVLFAQTIPRGVSEELNSDEFNREYSWRWVRPGVLETIDKITGVKQLYAIPKQWKNDSSRVDQVIDLLNIDTTQTAYKYRYWRTVPFGAWATYDLIVSDLNHNGFPELAGAKYKEVLPSGANGVLYEMQPDSSWVLQKKYDNSTSYPIGQSVTDFDNDGLMELNFNFKGLKDYNYESRFQSSFPDSLNFVHHMWEMGGNSVQAMITNLDKDSLKELVYVGDDSLVPTNQNILFIAEYKPPLHNFLRDYRMIPENNIILISYTTGDLDRDNKMEVFVGGISGEFFVIECDSNDRYSIVFTDTLGFWNPYLCAVTNDIDGNGRPELFMGGFDSYLGMSGYMVKWYESTQDNRFVMVRSLFIRYDEFFYLKSLKAKDVDLDGKDELILSVHKAVLILKYNQMMGQFDTFYSKTFYQSSERVKGISLCDIIDSSKPELMITFRYITNKAHLKTQIYKTDFVLGMKIQENTTQGFSLFQNYPNPFNNSTRIDFHIPKKENINLSVYDLTGKEVIKLIKNKHYLPGDYFVTWNGRDKNRKEVSSGIYLYVLSGTHFRTIKKLVLLK